MMQLELGVEAIRSYKRLPYTAWHALAEFVDNSTQSYINNRELLDARLEGGGGQFEVSISYDRQMGLLRIADNAMGMSFDELEYALRLASRQQIRRGDPSTG